MSGRRVGCASTADGKVTLDATRRRGFAAPPVARRPSSLLQPKPELDRGRVVQGDQVDVRLVVREVLRVDVEDPLLVSRIEAEGRVGSGRNDVFVHARFSRPADHLHQLELRYNAWHTDGATCAITDPELRRNRAALLEDARPVRVNRLKNLSSG